MAEFAINRNKILDNSSLEKIKNGDITKLIFEFSWPTIVGMLVQSCYNIISRVYIGNSPEANVLGLAALMVCFPIMLLLFACACWCGLGGGNLYSIKLGERKYKEAAIILGTSITLLIITGSVPAIIFYFKMDDMLRFFGATSDVMPYAKDYLGIILLGNIFACLGFGLNAFIRADGSPAMSMYTQILSALVNIALAPILIFLYHLGMKGAAFATIIAQFVSMVWVISYFFSKKATVRLTPNMFVWDLSVIKKVLGLGTAPFVMQLINSLILLILNKTLVVYGGSMAISAMGILYGLQTVIFMPVVGISQGIQPIMGYNYGAKVFSRVVATLKRAMIFATVFITSLFLTVLLAKGAIIACFTDNDELRQLTAYCLPIWYITFPIVGIQIIGSCYFQSIGKVIPSLVLTSTRQFLFLVPALLILPKFFQLNGILWSEPLADILSFIVTSIWVYVDVKKRKKLYGVK